MKVEMRSKPNERKATTLDDIENGTVTASRRELFGWLSVCFAAIIIAAGWIWTFTRDVKDDITAVRERTDGLVDRTTDKLEEIHHEVNEVRVDVKGLQTDVMNVQQTLNRIDSKL